MVILGTFFNIRRKVSILACAIATATLGVEFSLASSVAHAVTVNNNLDCKGSQTTTFSPPLTTKLQLTSFSVKGAMTECVSLNGSTITSGTYEFTSQAMFSCETSSYNPFYVTYHWNNGKYSTVEFISFESAKPGGNTVQIAEGIVIDGEFKGDAVKRILTLITTQTLQCLSTGITNSTGPEELIFIQL